MSTYTRKIITYLESSSGKRYKIEQVIEYQALGDTRYWYHILYNDGSRFASDFDSEREAIRYLEEKVGNVTED
jgi:hypothetical protein